MKNICIRRTGRLGNFIQRIKNAIYVGLFYGYNIILPEHDFFNTTYIIINPDVSTDAEKIIDEYDFHYSSKIENIDVNLFKQNHDKVLQILKDIFIIKNEDLLDENDLLIHIRSGDLFEGTHPHSGYISPPLSYYTDIINKTHFNTIYLIAEDRKNPCINGIIDLYPKIIFKIQSLKEDVKLLISATNVISSFGTFIPQLLCVSDKIKNLYSPSYSFKCNKPGINNHYTTLTNYKTIMTPWKNSPEQHNLMMTYKLEA